MVSFAPNAKLEDGELLPGSIKLWASAQKAASVRLLLARLAPCFVSSHAKVRELSQFLGIPTTQPVAPPLTRSDFDWCLTELLQLTRMPFPAHMRQTVLALRYDRPCTGPQRPPATGLARVVCLFPMAACARVRVHEHRYQYDSGWRTDGMFLWVGQRKRKGHVEVRTALDDCCGTRQAVLMFTRPTQASVFTYLGRVRGYLPVADQDPATGQPWRAALALDASAPFELLNDDRCYRMAAGWSSQSPTKRSVCEALGLTPPARYHRLGYNVTDIPGEGQMAQQLELEVVRRKSLFQWRKGQHVVFICRLLHGDFVASVGAGLGPALACRRGVLDQAECAYMRDRLRGASGYTCHRGPAAGPLVRLWKGYRIVNRYTMDTRAGRPNRVNRKVRSGLVGCTRAGRPTAWTTRFPDRLADMLPLLRKCAAAYQALLPQCHSRQSTLPRRSALPGTPFQTLYVNHNLQTGLHQDNNTESSVMGVLVSLGPHVVGGQLQFPEVGVEVDLQPGDVLMFQPALWHNNRPLGPGCQRTVVVAHG